MGSAGGLLGSGRGTQGSQQVCERPYDSGGNYLCICKHIYPDKKKLDKEGSSIRHSSKVVNVGQVMKLRRYLHALDCARRSPVLF
jgi:hypothetical protein